MLESATHRRVGEVGRFRSAPVLIPLAVLVAVVLVANGWGRSSDRPLVVVVFPAEARYFNVLYNLMKVDAAAAGVDLERLDADRSASTQIDHIRSAALHDADVVAFAPIDHTVANAIAADWGPDDPQLLSFVHRPAPASKPIPEPIRTFISVDHRLAGRMLGQQVEAVVGDEARVLLAGGHPGAALQVERMAGFNEVAADYDGWEVVGHFDVTNWRLDEFERKFERALVNHNFDVVAVSWADGAALASHMLHGADRDVPVVAIGWTESLRESMATELVESTAYSSRFMLSQQIVSTSVALANGESVEPIIEIPQRIILDEDHDETPPEW